MYLSALSLQNFRSYTKKTITFSPEATIIVGPNAVGKTNILEAIMLMATGKSFRATVDSEMIEWNKPFARVNATVGDTSLEVLVTPTKKYLVNEVPRRQIDFVGNARAVLFWPEDLKLVTDAPSIRRKYLDAVLVQTDREYRRTIASYERGIRQRNRLLGLILEGKASRSQLLFWNQLLINNGQYITKAREQYIEFINSYQVSSIKYQATYDKSIISEHRLEQYKDQEVLAKATLVGPHRDDFFVTQETIDVNKYGSRGEQRLAVLWLKLAQLGYITETTQERPILLLDDVFSELDADHRKIVLSVIQSQQTILTSAHEDIIEELGSQTWQIIRL